MPTYQYECTRCGHNFEIFQGITEEKLNNCPKCNQTLRRLIGSGSGIIFKGTGFYATDYRKRTASPADNKQDKTCPGAKDGCKTCPSQQASAKTRWQK